METMVSSSLLNKQASIFGNWENDKAHASGR